MDSRSTPKATMRALNAPDEREQEGLGEASWGSGERALTREGGSSLGQLVAERYRLESLLAEGGMSRVYVAHDELADRRVALKIVSFDRGDHAQLRARYEREVAVLSQLKGPSFVSMFDHGARPECTYIAMELLEGESLHARLAREDRLNIDACARLLEAVGQGLEKAHELCIVHRDLKPSNLFYAKDAAGETIRILDFGIAKELWTSAKLTHAGALLGSPHYVSPEQARSGEVDHRSDLWSLGVILYRCLTGARPFDGPLSKLIVKIVKEQHEPPTRLIPQLPNATDAFFDRALAKGPEDRFATIREMVDAFGTVVSAAGEAARARLTPRKSVSEPARAKAQEGEPLVERTLIASAGYEAFATQASKGTRDSRYPTLEVRSPVASVTFQDPPAAPPKQTAAPVVTEASTLEPPSSRRVFYLAILVGAIVGLAILLALRA